MPASSTADAAPSVRLSPSERWLSRVLRHLPVRHGKHRLLDHVCPRVRARQHLRRRVPFSSTWLELDVDNLVGWHFTILRDFDPEVSEVLVAAAQDPSVPDVFWDVGANQGTCSYSVAAALPTARIVAIEPQRALTHTLVANLERVAGARFEVHPVGIGTEHAELELTVPDGNDGAATLHPAARGVTGRIERVTITTADAIVQASAHGWPTLLKIDVEGHEAVVVTSCLPAISSRRCRALVFENHDGEAAAFDTILRLAEEHGYGVYAIVKTPFRTRLVPTSRPQPRITDYAMVLDSLTTSPKLARLLR